MGSKAGGEVQVSEYYMTMQVGVCAASEGLELLSVKIGEKEAWRGAQRNNAVVKIDQPELFGGNKKEGGVRGLMWWLNGNMRQMLPGPLWSRMGLNATTAPGFRGIASLFFTGLRNDVKDGTDFFWPGFGTHDGSAADEKGFYWSANNPYLKTISVRVRRPSVGLNPSIALIQMPDDSLGNEQFASNPAHMIFECMTDPEWGMGESYGAFNIGSYEQVAQALYDEGFGLNMIWNRQDKIESFVQEILDHIQAAQFVDPATGKHTLKLLRAVDPEIPVAQINPDNAKLSGFKMKLWGEVSNEVVVTWTNPETSKEETVTSQDLAAIAMQGAQPSSTSRNYYGIPSQALAQDVADRDLAAVVHPIATCEAEVSKQFWKTIIYDVVELTWPERSIESAFFRVSNVTASKKSNTVKLSLYEDIWSLDRATYAAQIDTGWVNPSLPPEPLVNYQLGTAPAFMTAAALGLDDVGDLPYPEAISAIVIGPDSADDVSYELVGYTSTVTGEIVQESMGERQLRGTWLSDIALEAENSTRIQAMPNYMGVPLSVGQFLLIGAVDDEDTEIAVVKTVAGSGCRIDRGMLDTTPKDWPIGTRMWAIPVIAQVPDITRRSAFETASYHFRTRTSVGLLDLADAPQQDILLSERPHLPNRPAKVAVANVRFGTYNLGSETSVLVTWARRNRIHESTQAMKWNDNDIAPEVGQTTTIHVMQSDRTPIISITGLTGTSYLLSRDEFGGHASVIVKLVAVRDGMESLQGHEISITTSATVGDIFAFSGDEAANTLALSGDQSPGNLIV